MLKSHKFSKQKRLSKQTPATASSVSAILLVEAPLGPIHQIFFYVGKLVRDGAVKVLWLWLGYYLKHLMYFHLNIFVLANNLINAVRL